MSKAREILDLLEVMTKENAIVNLASWLKAKGMAGNDATKLARDELGRDDSVSQELLKDMQQRGRDIRSLYDYLEDKLGGHPELKKFKKKVKVVGK